MPLQSWTPWTSPLWSSCRHTSSAASATWKHCHTVEAKIIFKSVRQNSGIENVRWTEGRLNYLVRRVTRRHLCVLACAFVFVSSHSNAIGLTSAFQNFLNQNFPLFLFWSKLLLGKDESTSTFNLRIMTLVSDFRVLLWLHQVTVTTSRNHSRWRNTNSSGRCSVMAPG